MGNFTLPPNFIREIQALTGRVATLERTRTIPTGTAAPTSTAAAGAMYLRTSTSQLYVSFGGGTWKAVTLS